MLSRGQQGYSQVCDEERITDRESTRQPFINKLDGKRKRNTIVVVVASFYRSGR